jgi:hypothetical protein
MLSICGFFSEQYEKLLELLKTASFAHPLAKKNQFSMNGTDGFAKGEIFMALSLLL